ncbi:kynurenine 3-monooxygenase mitochondrial precursor [Spathaspora passalidarum NRRL Y-27907]|uniref:Kynurenine 3-monooxygenase n=1 Tax=Spathaspora passalidarum (strain NRRL Y-27907 / 11-Y1) TaxID=619300 RepID=G3AQW9_SPAPN|nr:kynurenine 3-monooxygenase mitochondrial precursor [Spathaspora passalidarum NRRL Y-27907]EGW31198.1 kynurenine 3-monooxygenase mitochondrial precursor [Spathaspora passalidarum NRRL Y-27907]
MDSVNTSAILENNHHIPTMVNSHDSSSQGETVGIVGAGLVGCLAALAFAKKGYSVTLFELRSDPRTVKDRSQKNLRSINLAISNRGIRAMKYVDEEITDRVLEYIVPMKGRMIHDLTGTKQESQLYGLYGECINSIDRGFLNECLLNELDMQENVRVLFDHKLIRLNDITTEVKPSMVFLDSKQHNEFKTFKFDYIVGADGAHSQFRYQMSRFSRLNYSQNYVDMQYLELYIPPNEDPEAVSRFHINPNHLHIWPRHNYMLIALANKDGSFTSTFFSPWSVIESLKTSEEFLTFFQENFPDAYDLIGEEALATAYEKNPRGSLMQVSAYPYHSPNGRAILIGDAAHSMVPFYGQGMNCGFEDVRVLMELIEETEDIQAAFIKYSDVRKKDLDAICKLALENFYEMSTKVTSIGYLIKKNLDYTLAKYCNGKYFQWLPLYTMISFRDDIPYHEAVEIEARQQKTLTGINYAVAGAAIVGVVTKLLQLYSKLNKK